MAQATAPILDSTEYSFGLQIEGHVARPRRSFHRLEETIRVWRVLLNDGNGPVAIGGIDATRFRIIGRIIRTGPNWYRANRASVVRIQDDQAAVGTADE